MNISAYYRLARFDKPVGILLLWAPTAWALWLANQGKPPLYLVFLFSLGTLLMRAAGCVVNDIADRHVDKYVERTQKRPITTGELSIKQALFFLFLLLLGALCVLVMLPVQCVVYALVALLLTVIYPFCKRFIQAPQLVLGLAFSMSVPMVYAASGASMGGVMVILLLINVAWTLAYDTQYAMVDRKDDLLIGIKSTAILFARFDIFAISLLQIFFHGLWFLLAELCQLGSWYYLGWLAGGFLLIYQYTLIRQRQEKQCFKAFLNNSWYGLVMWLAIIMA